MGLTIHYKGNLKNKIALPQLVEEVKDVAEIFGWPYEIYETEFAEERTDATASIYGIQFTPPKCETVSFCFLSNGRLISIWSLCEHIQSLDKNESLVDSGSFVKTQFAGWQVHKTLIMLFRHLGQKYFKKFKVVDEAGYWETDDEEILKNNFIKMGFLLDGVEKMFSEDGRLENESVSKYAERIMKEFYKKISGTEDAKE